MKHASAFTNIIRLAASAGSPSRKGLINLKKTGLILALGLGAAESAVGDTLTTENIGGVEVEIRRAGDGSYPLIIFSHGMGGCPGNTDGIQGRLADAGYIVVAPKHADCLSGSSTPDVAWNDPENWTDQTNRNRRDDIHAVLDALPSSAYGQYVKDFSEVGCMGQSMGGYTCMGIGGAWSSWQRSEVKAVAALSPWHRPYLVQGQVPQMTDVQTLYQGGTLDNPITAELTEANGTYAQTWPAKYIQVFNRAGHSAWTDGILSGRFHGEMNYYIKSFFNAYLKNGAVSKLEVKKSRVSTLDFEH